MDQIELDLAPTCVCAACSCHAIDDGCGADSRTAPGRATSGRWTPPPWPSEMGVSILHAVHFDCDLPMSPVFIFRNIEDGNAWAGS
jgi:hypothetical protein